ncbi:hypothetical protein SAMN05421676_104309 [Salinibacillus kushneri]|uniref:YlxP-like protein n=1 Tax=Salinibacillus kushneri TaxID=237682 RepID=A0A1I0E6G5_9BACI|nr:DUF503 family protein [Salinibacillus kushneri]SET40412.1 hypothetical protein SAMN05421676_104309 [Salinibacillus kushneri]
MILYLEIECFIYDTQSLKQKRSVLKRLIHKIRHLFNVSISELDYQDLWQRTAIGIAHVSSDKIQAEKVLQEVLKVVDSFTELEVTHKQFEWL